MRTPRLYHPHVSSSLPPCGLYRTVRPIAGLEAGRLVYFHNHGDPGAGFYLPERWSHNRAHFSSKGITLPDGEDPHTALFALPAEGFYRVKKAFFCCAKRCVELLPDQLLQLGYNGAGKPLLFHPTLRGGTITVPDRGTMIDDAALEELAPLHLQEAEARDDLSIPRGIVIH